MPRQTSAYPHLLLSCGLTRLSHALSSHTQFGQFLGIPNTKKIKLNRAQKVHLASLVDKISLGYFAAVGGVAWLNTDLFALHAVALFTIMQPYAPYLLKGDDDARR